MILLLMLDAPFIDSSKPPTSLNWLCASAPRMILPPSAPRSLPFPLRFTRFHPGFLGGMRVRRAHAPVLVAAREAQRLEEREGPRDRTLFSENRAELSPPLA